jgi:hypothetical protein
MQLLKAKNDWWKASAEKLFDVRHFHREIGDDWV